jgi:hypothetical protein
MFKVLAIGVAAVAAIAVAIAGTAAGESNTTIAQAKAAGWNCNPEVLIVGYFHCAPPGKPSVADLIAGTDEPSIVLRVYHPDGTFAGTEHLMRADLYQGQACPQDDLAEWDLLPFGYRACHHFDT